MAHARWIAPSLIALTAALPAADPTLTTVLKVGATDDGLPTGPGATISYQWQVVDQPPGSGLVSFTPRTVIPADGVGYTNSATASLASAKAGTYTFRVVATDRGGLSATSSNVVVTVYSQNPTISDITAKSATVGVSSGAIAFTVTDRDPSAADSAAALTCTATSSNTAVVPNSFTFGGSGTNRTISFTPTGAGTATVQVKVTDAQGRAAYDTFVVTVAAASPEIAVDLNAADIVDGATAAAIPGTQPGVQTTINYRIRNTGSASLSIPSGFSASNQVNCSVSVTQPATSIAAGASATLAVRVTPTAAGTWSFRLSGATNDSNENPFDFGVTGSAVDPNASLVAYSFDSLSGTTVADGSGNGRDAIASGSPVLSTGKVGQGMVFDGTDDVIEDADAEAYLNGLSAVTVSIWVKSDVIGTERGFLSGTTPNGNDTALSMRYDDVGSTGGGNDVIKCAITLTGGSLQLESSALKQTTAWQHLVLVGESGQQLKLYINGVLDTPTSNSAAVTGTLTGLTTLLVGRGPKDTMAGTTANPNGWDGMIDDLKIYGRALSATEALAVYNAANGAPEIAVDRSGTNIADGSTAAAVTGTIAGTATTITYRIQNTGTAPLTLGSFAASALSNCSVTLTQPSTTIAAGASGTLAVQVTPTAGGTWSVALSGSTNDSDENPFNFVATGTAAAPEIAVDRSGANVADAGTSSITGTVPGVQTTVNYRVQNTGNATLTLGSFAISGASNVSASVTQPGASIPAGGSATLAVGVTPSARGAWSFVLTGSNNDSNENPFNFTVNGTANQAPAVTAPVNRRIAAGTTAALDATVVDPDSTPTVSWSKVSGPGVVTFSATAAIDTSAQFSQDGIYVLRLTAQDGTSTRSADCVVAVDLPGATTIDAGMTGFSQSAGWTFSGVPGADGNPSQYATSASATASWAFTTAASGWYDAQVYLPIHANSLPNQTFQVAHGFGTSAQSLNLTTGVGRWVSLGVVQASGSLIRVTTSGGGARIGAARVIAVPGTVVDNGTAGYSETVGGWGASGLLGFGSSTTRFSWDLGATAQWSLGSIAEGRILFRSVPHSVNSGTWDLTVGTGATPKAFQLSATTGVGTWIDLGRSAFTGSGFVRAVNAGSGSVRADSVWACPWILVDNADVGYSEPSGTWSTSGLLGQGGTNTRFGDGMARWRSAVPAGQYRVWWFKTVHPSSASAVLVSVNHDGGTSSSSQNLTLGTSGWVDLGTYSLSQGMVQVQASAAAGTIRADAIRLEPVGGTPGLFSVPLGGG